MFLWAFFMVLIQKKGAALEPLPVEVCFCSGWPLHSCAPPLLPPDVQMVTKIDTTVTTIETSVRVSFSGIAFTTKKKFIYKVNIVIAPLFYNHTTGLVVCINQNPIDGLNLYLFPKATSKKNDPSSLQSSY